MERIKEVKHITVDNEHEFYCDLCGTYIGSSEEYDDGYAPEVGRVHLEYTLANTYSKASGKTYVYDKHLCLDCKEGLFSNIECGLTGIGFISKENDEE